MLQELKITVNDGPDVEQVYHLASTAELFARARLQGLRLVEGDHFMISSAGGSFVMDLSGVEWGENVTTIRVDLSMDVASPGSCLFERQRSRDELSLAASRIRVRQHILENQQQRLSEGDRRLALLETKIKQNSTTVMGRLLGRFGLMRRFKV